MTLTEDCLTGQCRAAKELGHMGLYQHSQELHRQSRELRSRIEALAKECKEDLEAHRGYLGVGLVANPVSVRSWRRSRERKMPAVWSASVSATERGPEPRVQCFALTLPPLNPTLRAMLPTGPESRGTHPNRGG